MDRDDPVAILICAAVAGRASEIREQEREDLAVRIRNHIVDAIS